MLNKIILTVEHTFPAGTKRRKLLNAVVKPVAKVFGFPVMYVQPDMQAGECVGFVKLINKADEIEKAGNTYWESIVNILKMKTELFFSNPEGRLVFPKYEKPVVSILIVTFNKVEYTFQCLETIKAYSDMPYEVIIVDNNSSDRTIDLLERLENVTVINNRENVGFLRACNHGATHAKGEFILFLNNDTQVGPNWLEQLVSTARKYHKCGAVGAKLVFPNGKLQEAGSIVWQDGSTLGYGRSANPLEPQFSYLREVDYCSGACLLVRKDIYSQLGGFDERYAPAYYEEADLCFGIRKLGYKIVYQPEVKLLHYEFGSGSFNKANELCLANKAKFTEKWEKELKKNHKQTAENILKARDKRTGRKILVIDDRIPAPYFGSGLPRTYELICFLAELGYVVTYLPLQFPEMLQPETNYLQEKGIEVIYSDSKINLPDFMKGRDVYYDLFFVSRPHNARETLEYIRGIAPSSPIIYDAEAVFAQREILKAELDGTVIAENYKKKLVSAEMSSIKFADAVVTVSEYEKKSFVENGISNVHVWGHPVSARATRANFKEREGILFLGSFTHPNSPNEDAVLYFVKEIFPAVKKNLNCKLLVVGTNNLDSVKDLAKLPSIEVTGRVDDIGPYFEKCRVFVVPHRFAAGIPLKLIEAMSYGIPAVTSPLIARQLSFEKENYVLIGDTTANFAKKVIELYTDETLWNNLRTASLNYVEENCNPRIMKRKIDEIISSARKLS